MFNFRHIHSRFNKKKMKEIKSGKDRHTCTNWVTSAFRWLFVGNLAARHRAIRGSTEKAVRAKSTHLSELILRREVISLMLEELLISIMTTTSKEIRTGRNTISNHHALLDSGLCPNIKSVSFMLAQHQKQLLPLFPSNSIALHLAPNRMVLISL